MSKKKEELQKLRKKHKDIVKNKNLNQLANEREPVIESNVVIKKRTKREKQKIAKILSKKL